VKTHFVLNAFFSEIRAIYGMMRKSVVKLYRPQKTI